MNEVTPTPDGRGCTEQQIPWPQFPPFNVHSDDPFLEEESISELIEIDSDTAIAISRLPMETREKFIADIMEIGAARRGFSFEPKEAAIAAAELADQLDADRINAFSKRKWPKIKPWIKKKKGKWFFGIKIVFTF